ncbi:MAG: DEAD/DEAH box helicase family protein [Candidatus Aenigmarchaeota archaeon]|nr:DEAD/DEAH box helicase family protein [Candidatus Aenigmarchaeota archaeon]
MAILKLESLEPREYQRNIAKTAGEKNTLVVLPTGMGKTLISLLVASDRLEKFPESKIMILSPTRPLSTQHEKTFETFTTIPEDEIILLTGKIKPDDRVELYKKAKIIIATPQTIENDLENSKIDLSEFSFMVFDEAHRAVKEYAYPYIAKKFRLQSKYPLILGLTASPGAAQEKIQEICDNLFIKGVEIRSEGDVDVEEYVQPVEHENIYVEMPEEFKEITTLLEEALKDDLYWLKEHHYTFTYKPTKTMLLDTQKKIMASYMRGSKNYGAFWGMMRTAGAIKLTHAIEMLETQGVRFLYDFLKKIEKSKKRTDERLFKDPRIREAVRLCEELSLSDIEHPKLRKVIEVAKELISKKPNPKIIVFANYRTTVEKINKILNDSGISSEILIGQTIKEGKGLTQQQQLEVLNRFKEGQFTALVCSSVGEEGLDIPNIDYAIFYESVPSEIRHIQRRGRVGRQSVGKVIFLITKGTRDEVYYYASLKKEKKMKGMLYRMKDKGIKKKNNLLDWV